MLILVALACTAPDTDAPPGLGDPVYVVPSDGLPVEVVLDDANNNLGVVMHEGRRYLAWRTSPTHFASEDTVLWVVSSADGVTWDYEARFDLDTDLREMQFLSWNGDLWLYFAVLGTNPLDFDPQGMRVSHMEAPGTWSEPQPTHETGFIPWRTRVVDGVPYMVGYTGGENIYDNDRDPIRVHWLTTSDGITWVPVGRDPVHEGGASETDWTFLEDGSLVAVLRNEAGENGEFGSLVCTAPAADLGTWTCDPDPRKYDSPLIINEGGRIWLIARRNVTETGSYDLGQTELDDQRRFLNNQGAYWYEPKRCSIWEVHPDMRTVSFVEDLPSKGDTCFPDALPMGDGRWEVYNYTSPLDGADVDWIEGQLGTTGIYRIDVTFPAPS